MGSSLSAKAGTLAIAATLSGLLALGTAPFAGAAESAGNSGSTPAATNADYGASSTAPNSANANADDETPAAYGQTGTTPADANANGGNSAGTPAADQSRGQGGQGQVQGDNGESQGGSHESTSGQGNTPPGNNGTIKIHDDADDHTHHNQPHVDCDFFVDFYGYDGADGQATTMTFQLISPTKPATAHPYTRAFDLRVDERTSGGQWDHEEAFTADEIVNGQTATPHPKQGYHVKLTVTVDDALPQGAEVKHKVFWVEPCTTVQPTEETVTTGSASVSGESFTTATPSATAASETASAAVLGEHFVQLGSPAAATASENAAQPADVQVMGVHYSRSALATTGAAIATLVGLGLALLAAGWALTRASGRRSEA